VKPPARDWRRALLPALLVCLAAGWLGAARLAAIDAGALVAPAGSEVQIEGHALSPARVGPEGISAEVASAAGRVLVQARDLEGIGVGEGVRARGTLTEAPDWRAEALRRHGIAMVLEAEVVEPTGEARGGLTGRVDSIRRRAERALERGMPARESALARGFVLGQDDAIDPATREDFKRSGLAHLLAVSGQNVVLLCLLAWPILALLGITLRARLLALLFLIALYVPVTGAGPSIQRAAVMGGAGLIAALADRPRARWQALFAAVLLTLAANPRVCGDIGWQLSFAAVIGIFLWTRRLSKLLRGDASAPGREAEEARLARSSPRAAVADGVAMSLAATLATAPLMAHHFEAVSVAALPANLLALPAVAPAMWLGMLAGIVGQVPAVPVEPLNWLNSHCLAYIGQVARWFGAPSWAQVDVSLQSPIEVGLAYALLAGFAELGLAAAQRRRGTGLQRPFRGRRWTLAAGVAALVVLGPALTRAGDEPQPPEDTLVVRVLDVGQGDSILLDPPGGAPILVDTGPPGAGVAGRLRELGVESLGAVVVTHDQSDHAGGVAELLRGEEVEGVAYAAASDPLREYALAADSRALRLAEGGELRSGRLRLSALWPPRELLAGPGEDPNSRSLVLLAEWGHFSMLLTGDGEAEAIPLDPGPVDVLKVAHHGSEDAGLPSLLDRTAPKLALISVGENPYGHPAPETLAALGEHGVPVLRTDREGEIVLVAGPAGWSVRAN
jgi:competence protein ComEC